MIHQLKKVVRTKHTLPAYKRRLIITDLDIKKRELLDKELSKDKTPIPMPVCLCVCVCVCVRACVRVCVYMLRVQASL